MEEIKNEVSNMFYAVRFDMTDEAAKDIYEERQALTNWLQPLLAVDLIGVEESFYNHERENVMRADKVVLTENKEALFKTASNFEEGSYRVPPIIE